MLNNAVFDGELPPPTKIHTVYMKEEYGWAIPYSDGSFRLTLLPRYKTRRLFLSTLAHEMVHGWENYHGLKMQHGATFFSWAPRIKRTTTLTLERKIETDGYTQ